MKKKIVVLLSSIIISFCATAQISDNKNQSEGGNEGLSNKPNIPNKRQNNITNGNKNINNINSGNVENNIPMPISLLEDFKKYDEKNKTVFQPGSIMDEDDLINSSQIKFPLNVQVLKNNEEILNSNVEVYNSRYIKLFTGNDIDSSKLSDNGMFKFESKVMEGLKKENVNLIDSLEIGLIVNVRKNKMEMLSQVWFEQETNKNKVKISSTKNKDKVTNAEISENPTVDRKVKEILIVHKFKSKAVASWNGYKIILSPI